MALCDKDRIDALMKLVDFRMQRIVSRRDHEWKVTVGLWVLLATGILELGNKPIIWVLPLVLLLVVAGHAFWWVRGHWMRSKEDGEISFHFGDYAEKILKGEAVEPLGTKPLMKRDKMPRRDWWLKFWDEERCRFQVCTTALFAVALWYVNWFH